MFTRIGDVHVELEHSLVSLSKWESNFEKPFLSMDEKTPEEMMAYIEFMVLTEPFSTDSLKRLTKENMDAISSYINRKHTATTIHDDDKKKPHARAEIVTSELIYYWLTAMQIPYEVETWNLNRLFTMIRVTNIKNAPPKKMNPREAAARNRRLNEERRARMGSKG